ncbi:aminoglycoside 6-adenylyltransferase [Myroides sp. WP-1]|uniref:aminoglycoside 6-adenylyltransferase n=1 Tax=Myroides sp. WP-1 TaxID=2759944 RepID=UPI0015F9E9E2|nr:aminoglycoside 6-adenylyltransferase [Myroides sp. WP-1]MBB1137892.1 aminoglycoside 6-adenylyltransferase [Myroides sp. WP-1]
MYNPIDIQKKILDLASNDSRIRAVLLQGSRANIHVVEDEYQDFDLLFVVDRFESFLQDRSWLAQLGTPLVQQLPDEMELGRDLAVEKVSFTLLTIFQEGYRLDITLFPKEKMSTHFQPDSLTVVWLDKEDMFLHLSPASDSDYHVQKPTQRLFNETSNEFWWCVTNVAKGLKRGEITYAKEMLETVVRPVFMDMIAWHIGAQNNFAISIGKSGKFMQRYLTEGDYQTILSTYSDAALSNNWQALFVLMDFFFKKQREVAAILNFNYDEDEANRVRQLVDTMYALD